MGMVGEAAEKQLQEPFSFRREELKVFQEKWLDSDRHLKAIERRSRNCDKSVNDFGSVYSRMEKLVDIVPILQEKSYAFELLLFYDKCFKTVRSLIFFPYQLADGVTSVKGSLSNSKRLGPAGLALHYANIITQIDTLVARSGSMPPSTRDTLYQGLPPSIKAALRTKLQVPRVEEEFTVPQIKSEMEKILEWLVPIATNTTKSELNRKPAGQMDLIKIETLHHADKEMTEIYILELVVWLHHLVSLSKFNVIGGIRSPIKSPIRSPTQKTIPLPTHKPTAPSSPLLTVEDQEMLRDVSKRKLTPGISKSQEFDTAKNRLCKYSRLSKSNNHSPTRGGQHSFPFRRPSSIPIVDFVTDKTKALDVIDRVDTFRNS
ncbi:hypothetical protein GIB67_026293 [Kingdonia uniflora]|uniref:DUF668 domain-containing protein n=1 Tax=Kingdonia uniflora TaxID=39325 RepID=A0A7J7L9X0_9MAGN|nr:hypothetical protein GIB67_026293 [Kingdonia uniflora]